MQPFNSEQEFREYLTTILSGRGDDNLELESHLEKILDTYITESENKIIPYLISDWDHFRKPYLKLVMKGYHKTLLRKYEIEMSLEREFKEESEYEQLSDPAVAICLSYSILKDIDQMKYEGEILEYGLGYLKMVNVDLSKFSEGLFHYFSDEEFAFEFLYGTIARKIIKEYLDGSNRLMELAN